MTYRIPFNKPALVGCEIEYIVQAVKNGQISGDGPFTLRCHEWMEDRLGCRKALLTHSCTAALEMASMLCDIQPGDEIILPSFTFVSTANAFVLRGGVPVFVDIREDTLNLDESKITTALTSRTKAIVPVHYAGVPCEMGEILSIAHDYRVYVIEDAAQALLSSYKDKYLGTFGQLGCLSFHETKNIISGEGGALLINDASLIERAEMLREKGTDRSRFFRGQVDKYTWMDIGSSFLPNELTAAFLMAQLEKAEAIIAKRCMICERYSAGLNDLAQRGFINLPGFSTDSPSNGHMYYIIARSQEERELLRNFLRNQSILSVFHYVPLHTSPAGLRYGRRGSDMQVTDKMSGCLLRLPLYYELTTAEVDEVVSHIYDFFLQ